MRRSGFLWRAMIFWSNARRITCWIKIAVEERSKEVLISIVEGYLNGTENGIHVDKKSGLVFSPSHYT